MTVDPAGSGAPMSDRMQSLLSRAAEDQLAEQRQVAGALTDLRAQMQQIAGDVATLRQGAAAGGGANESALGSLSADLREAVRLLAERLDGVARLVQQRGSDLVELNAAVNTLHSAVRGQGEALGGIGSGLAALPSFGERIGGLQNNLAALHQQLAGIEELSAAISTLQQRVEGMDHGLRELKSAFAAIGARMAELPGRGDLDAAAGRSQASLAGLTDRLDSLDRAVSALPATLADMAPPPPPAEEQGGVDRLEQQIDELAVSQRDSIAATTDRLSSLEQQLDQVLAALTPPDEAHGAGPAGAEEDDPVLAEIAELREALLGDGGIVERLDAGDDEELDAKVAEAVTQAVAASEERLTAHIDEAVLALADALLRRRGRGGRAPIAPTVPAAAASASPEEVGSDVAAEEPEDADDDADDDVVPEWQTPPADVSAEDAAEAGEPAVQPEDANRRRRPWWRPGD